jgi:2'-5' RNA ligase
MMRSILLFPEFAINRYIQELRSKYDPLYGKIKPHVTLAFPFDSAMEKTALEEKVKGCLAGMPRFRIATGRVHYTDDNFMILDFSSGNEEIVKIHDELYSRVLPEFLNRKIEYRPHLTLGYFQDGFQLFKAMKDLDGFGKTETALIDKVYVETIGPDDESLIEFAIELG